MDSRTEMFRYFYPWRPFFVCVSVVSKGEFISLRDWRLANCVHVVWTLCKSCVIVWPVAAGIPTGGVRFLFCRNGDDIILFRCSREKSRIPCLICLPCLQKKNGFPPLKMKKNSFDDFNFPTSIWICPAAFPVFRGILNGATWSPATLVCPYYSCLLMTQNVKQILFSF